MKIGFQPAIEQKPREAFEFAFENDFTHLEFLLDHPYYHYERIDHSELLELKESYGIEILLHASSAQTNFIALSSVVRKASYAELEKTINFAYHIDCPIITIHIGWNPGFITSKGFVFKEEWYAEHNERVLIEEMIPFLKRNGEMIAIENTISLTEKLKEVFEKILSETDVKLTFDPGHYSIKEGHEIFLDNFERIVNVHLHDNRGEYDQHLPLGEGTIDFSFIPKGFKGYLTLELRDEDSILKSKEYLEGMWR